MANPLEAGLIELGIAAGEQQLEQLDGYRALLLKWNNGTNLVSRRDIQRLVPRHLLDSVSVLPWVRGDRIIDLGSGGGLPGLPIAIMRPQAQVTLLERSEKKCRFLNACVRELGLDNVQVIGLDAELYRPSALNQTLVSRAVAPPAKIWALGLHLLSRDGCMVLHTHIGADDHADDPVGGNEEAVSTGLPAGVQRSHHSVAIPGLPTRHEVLILEETRY
ncbi:MAG: 16S rRNA (guanine(527)-N(7))-methyltransferase RsmG [Pseudomonadota bacterium]